MIEKCGPARKNLWGSSRKTAGCCGRWWWPRAGPKRKVTCPSAIGSWSDGRLLAQFAAGNGPAGGRNCCCATTRLAVAGCKSRQSERPAPSASHQIISQVLQLWKGDNVRWGSFRADPAEKREPTRQQTDDERMPLHKNRRQKIWNAGRVPTGWAGTCRVCKCPATDRTSEEWGSCWLGRSN